MAKGQIRVTAPHLDYMRSEVMENVSRRSLIVLNEFEVFLLSSLYVKVSHVDRGGSFHYSQRLLNGVVNVLSALGMPQRLYYGGVACLYCWRFELSVLCGRCQRFTQVPEDTVLVDS